MICTLLPRPSSSVVTHKNYTSQNALRGARRPGLPRITGPSWPGTEDEEEEEEEACASPSHRQEGGPGPQARPGEVLRPRGGPGGRSLGGPGRSRGARRVGSSGRRGGERGWPGRRRSPGKKTATSRAAVTEGDKMAAPKGKLWVQAQLGLPPLLLLTMALAGGSGTAAAEAFDSVLGDTASCHRACQLTYPLHTYPKEEELYACQRGCRLFSICQFVDDGIDLNRTKLECESACTEAYSQPDEQYACHLGCQDQLPFAELRQEQLMSLMPRMHLLFPLTLVRSFWSDMMDSAQSFITSSWTFYLQADDGKIVIFQSKPEIQYAPQLEQEPTNLRESSLSKMSYLQMRNSQAHRNYLEDEESDGFLRCLSLNSGWILTTTLVLSVMVLLWICCAAVATAVEQYVPPEKLSIYGDLEFMNEQKLSRYPASSLVVVRSQTEDPEEAGPLPTKVNLAHSEI